MTAKPSKTKDELLLENALLKHGQEITDKVSILLDQKFLEFKKSQSERDETQHATNLEVEKRLTSLESETNALKVRIWSISGAVAAFAGVVGFITSNLIGG